MHCDRRAYTGVGAATTDSKILKRKIQSCLCGKTYDDSYLDFVAKIFVLNTKIYNENQKVWLSPRQLDSLLLNY